MTDLPYRYVIGLEIHVQLLTRTKLFCGCRTLFGLPPNSATCPVCLGLPGVLPVMNRQAFDLALRAALALQAQVNSFSKWDRKNYYYPDLPKNYQISQYDLPFASGGWLEIDAGQGPRRIHLIRVHLEEDAGKMLHDEQGTGKDSLVDLNRAGTPLLEIVSQPELRSPEEARVFLEEMALLMREVGVSDCEMQQGSLRCDANVNLHISQNIPSSEAEGLGVRTPIVEIKNLNSFRFLERAVRFEASRQYQEWQANPQYVLGQVPKSTVGWDEVRERTTFQRSKESEADYRYFPEPDLPPVQVEEAWLERIRSEMGEVPSVLRHRLGSQYGLSEYDVGVLTAQGRELVAYFEEVARVCADAKAACNWVTNQVLGVLKEDSCKLADFSLSATRLGELLARQAKEGWNKQLTTELFLRLVRDGVSVDEAIQAQGVQGIDLEALRAIVRKAMEGNPKAVADYRKGKAQAANALKGAVMRETRGAVKVESVDQVLQEELNAGE